MKISPDGMVFESECPVLIVKMKGDVANQAAKVTGVLVTSACTVRNDTTVIVDASNSRPEGREDWMREVATRLEALGEITRIAYSPVGVRLARIPFQQN